MASTPTKLMTFAEFERLPVPEGWRLELRHGELFRVPPPKFMHFHIQQILRDLLDKAAAGSGRVYTEVGFRAASEGEFRISDIAYASNVRWTEAVRHDYFLGVPEIVVEILSPSNSATEMIERERICLENGCLEFWLVDPNLKLIRVATPDGRAMTYRSGQEIPLALFNTTVALDAIFAPAEN